MKTFRLLCALLPRAFRDAFGEEMHEVFAAQLREARTRGLRAVATLWLRTIRGTLSTAWHERRTPGQSRAGGGSVLQFSDLRHTVRRLAAAPGFTFAAVATLAICMGANLTMFATVETILLRPLPFQDPDRLVIIYNTYPRANVLDDGASVANYYERRGRVGALAGVSLHKNDAVIVGDTGSTEREFVMRVTPEFFATLGVAPAQGRAFHEHETSPGAASVVILTDAYWRQQLGADPRVVGRTLRVNGAPYAIVGVMPEGFSFLSSRARLYLPYVSMPDDRRTARRHSGSSSQMIARLAPGVTLDAAQAEIDAHNAVMERENPQRAMIADTGFRSVVAPIHARHVAWIRPTLVLLQAGATVLLLIGLVNVANLCLIRAGSRTRELAVRRAIGARTSHLVAAITMETLLLAALGTAAAVPIAQAGLALFGRFGAARLPLGAQISLNATSVLAAAAAALVAGALLGAAIAAHHLRGGAGEVLRAASHRDTGRHAQRGRHAILVTQIALSFVLLTAATLLAAGLRDLMRVSPGFQSTRLLTGQVSLPIARYRSAAALQSFIDRLTSELARTPGIAASGLSTNVPLSGNAMKSATTILGRPRKPGETPRGVYAYAVAGDYFTAMGIPLVEGRLLTSSDVGSTPRVCVVDEDYARRYWPSGGAIGQRLFLGGAPGSPDDAYTIVGIATRVKQASLSETDPVGAVYFTYGDRFDRALYIVSRTTLEPDALQSEIRRVVRLVDPELPVNNLRSMDARIADSLAGQRSPALLASVFAAVALLLTALGTYGVLGYAVAQRRREIGIRMALGARAREVRAQFLGLGLRLLAAGLALGLAGSWAVGRALRAALPAIPQAPAAALLGATAVMAVVCVAACLVPARRAARTSPIDVIRD